MSTINSLTMRCNLLLIKQQIKNNNLKRYLSTISEESKRQSNLFAAEKQRQRESLGRIEKINIDIQGPPDASLIMNKNISTPYDCAKHIGDKIVDRTAVALINKETLWHMHKPLPDSCNLEFLHYHATNPGSVNKAFWRTCSFLLGAVVSEAFKDNVKVQLHSFPSPNVKTGSFVYDMQLDLDNWIPTQSELKVLSIQMIKFCQQSHPIECLDVEKDLAFEMFKHNPHKTEQIPDIATHNGNKITLFKAGTHIDISRGPMVPNTDHLGRITVCNVHKLNTDLAGSPIYRFQGVALPKNIIVNHFAYSLIEERGRKLNSGRIPSSQTLNDDNSFVAQVTV